MIHDSTDKNISNYALEFDDRLVVSSETGATSLKTRVPLHWDEVEDEGLICQASEPSDEDEINGKPYQTCIMWYDGNGNGHEFYSVWSESDTIKFINSLVRVK